MFRDRASKQLSCSANVWKSWNSHPDRPLDEQHLAYVNIKQGFALIHLNFSVTAQVAPLKPFIKGSCSPLGLKSLSSTTLSTLWTQQNRSRGWGALSFCPVVQLCRCFILFPICLWLITLPVMILPPRPSGPHPVHHEIQMTVWCRGARQWNPDVWSMENGQCLYEAKHCVV